MVGTHIQVSVKKTGCIDYIPRKVCLLGHIHEITGDDLHGSLSRRSNPEIALIVTGSHLYSAVNRKVFYQIKRSVLIQKSQLIN